MASEHPLTVVVESVIYRSDDGRYGVLSARAERSGERLTLVGDLGGVMAGEMLSIRGRLREHATYGERFHVESFTPVTPSTREGLKRYLGSGVVPGVGPAMAERIVDRFGGDTLEVITRQSARLREIPGIGQKRAQALSKAVRARAREAESIAYLHGLGLGPAFAQRVRERYGDDATRVVRDDPYLMAEEIKGIGFRTADQVGKSLGYADDDPRRAAGAVLHLTGKAVDEGHVFIEREALLREARELSVPAERVEQAIDDMHRRGLLLVEETAVYAPPLYRAECRAAEALLRLSGDRPRPRGAEAALETALDDSLARAQQRAVETSLEQGLFVLTGGPGTGKTTTVRALVRAHHALRHRVLLCAPTGRAAKRLSETTGCDARTIHRLLEYSPRSGGFERGPDNPLEADLVLVDEASMLDLWLADRLLQAIPANCALVLVGDVDQLPPVGAGPVLRELIDSAVCPVIRLTEVFRQAQKSAIVRAAHDVLRDRVPTPTPSGQRGDGDLFLIRASTPEAIIERLLDALERMRSAYGLDPKRDVQVLTPMRRGPLGTQRLNEVLQQAQNPSPPGQAGFRRGDKVMQLKNDYEREVFNGDLGEVLEVGREGVRVDMGGRQVNYDGRALEALALAYASTIHKVQGSEFPAVVVVLHGSHHLLLSRALLYTAITRAKRLAVMLGAPKAIARAVHNTQLQATNSKLATRLRDLRARQRQPSAAITPS
ncbi:MAG: ATP-dependent RecD-like DNA helicase [Myxococcales bacterium]|nr:ATP-dependent RecD-like DNA helicase [Myxococcales bacterium]